MRLLSVHSGTRFGRYEIGASLAAGGMGEVYRAHDTDLDRTVAIKVLHETDPAAQFRIAREARALAALSHPHICPVYDVGSHNGIAFLVMQFLEGETLANRLARGTLLVAEAVRFAIQVADALDKAHRAGVVHGDLKPSNIMLTSTGAMLVDFGIARIHNKAVTDAGGDTVTTAFLPATTQFGSPHYLAPEQLEGRDPDARTDVWTFGCVLYEMLAGRRAFDAEDRSRLIAQILDGDPSPLSSSRRVSPALDRLVVRCLTKDPDDRWQTTHDLLRELEWLGESGLAESNDDKGSHVRSRMPIWSPFGLAACVALLLAAAAGGSTFARWRWPRESEPALATSFQVVSPSNASDIEQPTISPDGRTLAFIARIKDGTSALWIRPLESLEARPIADADSLAFPFWSPDSQSLAFFNDGQLKRVAVRGGPAQTLCVAPAGRGGAWSPSGVIVFASSAESPLSQVTSSGGTPKPATVLGTSPDERSHRFPQFLTDGRRFSYTAYLNESNRNPLLKVASLDATTTTVVTETSFARSIFFSGYMLFSRERSGPFLAQRFDETTLALTSEPVAVIDRLESGPVDGAVGISGSRTGVLTYQTTTANSMGQLTWFARSDRELAEVGQPATFPVDVESFSLSPDGTRVAVQQSDANTRRDDIWMVDVARGFRSRVTVDGTAAGPKWSPDGRRIAFTSSRPNNGYQDIYVAPSQGQGPAQPLLTSRATKFLWDWSTDGALLLFTAAEASKNVGNLWTLRLDGSGAPQRYLSSEFNKGEARFSPDARWVAYQSNESGVDQVFVQSFPDPATRYQVSSAGGTRPRWRHDGKELFYLSPDGKLAAVTIRSNGGLEVGTPTVLFRTSTTKDASAVNFEVAPDGRRFLIAEVVGQPSRSPITVHVNWNPFMKE